MLWVRIPFGWVVLNSPLCVTSGWWFSQCTPVSSTNKTDCYDTTDILLKVELNTPILHLPPLPFVFFPTPPPYQWNINHPLVLYCELSKTAMKYWPPFSWVPKVIWTSYPWYFDLLSMEYQTHLCLSTSGMEYTWKYKCHWIFPILSMESGSLTV